MRVMADNEFLDFKKYAKCPWIDCVHGMGLAGMGRCADYKGRWDKENCYQFITYADFESEWKAREDAFRLAEEVGE